MALAPVFIPDKAHFESILGSQLNKDKKQNLLVYVESAGKARQLTGKKDAVGCIVLQKTSFAREVMAAVTDTAIFYFTNDQISHTFVATRLGNLGMMQIMYTPTAQKRKYYGASYFLREKK